MKNTEIAYLAGIIDSDGCIAIHKYTNCKSYRVGLTVVQRDLPLVEWLYANFSGSVNIVHTKRKDKNDFYLRWLIADNRACNILKMVFPYLKLKVQQAELAIKLQELKNQAKKSYRGFSLDDIQKQFELYSQIRRINSPAETERAGSLTKEMRQSELTEMKNRQSVFRKETSLSEN